jgi:hypothetical protein
MSPCVSPTGAERGQRGNSVTNIPSQQGGPAATSHAYDDLQVNIGHTGYIATTVTVLRLHMARVVLVLLVVLYPRRANTDRARLACYSIQALKSSVASSTPSTVTPILPHWQRARPGASVGVSQTPDPPPRKNTLRQDEGSAKQNHSSAGESALSSAPARRPVHASCLLVPQAQAPNPARVARVPVSAVGLRRLPRRPGSVGRNPSHQLEPGHQPASHAASERRRRDSETRTMVRYPGGRRRPS